MSASNLFRVHVWLWVPPLVVVKGRGGYGSVWIRVLGIVEVLGSLVRLAEMCAEFRECAVT